MDVAALTSGTTLPSDSAAKKIAGDFDNFLKILTTQLANQDPLEPLDANEFTAQLVRFTQVEQAIAQNKKLEQLVDLIQTGESVAAVNYIGKVIEAEGVHSELGEFNAKWSYTLPAEAAQTAIVVRNSAGAVVHAATGATGAGKHQFEWDGKNSQGTTLPDGVYQISVIAKDAQGGNIAATTGTIGRVTAVENVDGKAVLNLGKVRVELDKVKAITNA